MDEIQKLLTEAREKALAGDLVEAKALREKASALREIKEEEVKAIGTPRPADTSARLPFTAEEETESQSSVSEAIKSVYVKKYGDIDRATGQIFKELYKTDNYPMLLATKYAALEDFCRYGRGVDTQLARSVLLTPEQVIKAIRVGVPVNGSEMTIKATMVEAQDVLGGFLVPEDMRMEIIQRLPGLTVVRTLARKYTTGRDHAKFLVRRGGNKRYTGNIRSAQVDESPANAGVSETNALFGEIDIPVHVNLANVPVSKSLLEDSGMDLLNDVLMPEFTAQAAIKEDEQFLVGTGIKEPQGVLNGTAANGSPFNSDVTVRNSTVAAAVTSFDAIVKAPYDLAGQYRANKKESVAWVFNSATASTLASLKNADGEYLWREMYGNNAVGAPDTLRGWKTAESEAMPSEAANTFPIIFGDWEGYRLVDRVGMSVERYSDSSTAATDSVVFYLRRRYGGQCAEGYRFVVIKCST